MSMKARTKNELFSWLFRIGCITFAYSIRLISVNGEFYAVFWRGVCELLSLFMLGVLSDF